MEWVLVLQFGRKKKKYRGKPVGPASILKEVEDKESEGEDEEDEDEDLSKYKLDEVVCFNFCIYLCFLTPVLFSVEQLKMVWILVAFRAVQRSSCQW